AADISATVDAIGLATARHVIVERERGVEATLRAEARAERGIAKANMFDAASRISIGTVLDACARVRKDIASSADFVKAVQAGTIEIPDFTGHVLGYIKERFAKRRLQSIADTLNKLNVKGKKPEMYSLVGRYFLDEQYVAQRLLGKTFTWQVKPQQGMGVTVDFRIAAMPPGATSIDDALLIVPHEQKATTSDKLGDDAKKYVL
ncbi:MAG: hypothetical protein Q6370_021215, partial [Candidatus Sigynarchaeota archaeon]